MKVDIYNLIDMDEYRTINSLTEYDVQDIWCGPSWSWARIKRDIYYAWGDNHMNWMGFSPSQETHCGPTHLPMIESGNGPMDSCNFDSDHIILIPKRIPFKVGHGLKQIWPAIHVSFFEFTTAIHVNDIYEEEKEELTESFDTLHLSFPDDQIFSMIRNGRVGEICDLLENGSINPNLRYGLYP